MAGLNPWQFILGLMRIIASRPRLPRGLADNEPLRLILQRRSVRAFKEDPIDDEVWTTILEAGRVAPSTVNLQTWSFACFTAPRWRAFFGAPVPFAAPRAVIVLSDTHRARRVVQDFPRAPLCELTVGVMNASLAAMNMTLAAEAMGVSSVMLSETGRTGFYDADFLARKLELPAGVLPIMSIAFGYAATGTPAMPPKLPLAAIAFDGAYRETDRDVLEQWYREQQAGYMARNRGMRFGEQIAYYNRRLGAAEADLERLVHRDTSSNPGTPRGSRGKRRSPATYPEP